jgi:hypothetical protein
MTADHLNPPRKGAAADAAERAGENFTDCPEWKKCKTCDTLISYPGRDFCSECSQKQPDRREAARRFHYWVYNQFEMEFAHDTSGRSPEEIFVDRLLEAMK